MFLQNSCRTAVDGIHPRNFADNIKEFKQSIPSVCPPDETASIASGEATKLLLIFMNQAECFSLRFYFQHLCQLSAKTFRQFRYKSSMAICNRLSFFAVRTSKYLHGYLTPPRLLRNWYAERKGDCHHISGRGIFFMSLPHSSKKTKPYRFAVNVAGLSNPWFEEKTRRPVFCV